MLCLTRAQLALQIFYHLHFHPTYTYGGVKKRLARLLLVVEKNGKNVRKLVKNDNETISVKFSLNSKLWPSAAKNVQSFEFFAVVEHRFGKPPLSRELL